MDTSIELTEEQDFHNMPAQSQIPTSEIMSGFMHRPKVKEIEHIEELPAVDLEASVAKELGEKR